MDVHESDRSSNNPRPPSDLKESHIRSQSPTLTRIPSSNSTETSAVSSSTPHRSVSSEKRRHATLPSPWGLPTAAVHGVGAVARKVISNRLTESLWPSRRSSSSSHLQSDASSIPNAKRDNFSNESLSDHTSKTSLNVANEKTAKLPVSSKPTPEREKTHLKGKKSKPLGGSHVRPINQHRRPRKTNPNVIDQSENLKPSDGSDVSTINSNVIDQSENAKCPDGSDVNKIGSNVIDESENSKPPDGSDVNTKNSNVIDESENSKPPDGSDVNTTASNVIDESENLKPSDGSHVSTAGSNVIDQPENSKILDDPHVRSVNQNRWPSAIDSNVIGRSVNSKPPDSSHVRLVNQHRWSETIRSNVSDQSENSKAPDGSHGRLVNQHRWPGTIGSNVLNRNINPSNEVVKTCFTPDTGVNLKKMLPNYANKPIQESSSDAMNLLSSSLVDDGRLKADKSERISASVADDDRLEIDKLQRISNLVSSSSQPSSPRKSYSLASRSVSSSRTRVNPSPASRGASLAPSKGVNYSPIVRGVSLTPATREVSLTRTSRGVSLTPTTRRVNPSPTIQEVDPLLPSKETDLSLATREVNPSLITRGGSPFPATRGVTPSLATREVSLTPTIKGTSLTPPERGVSPTPNAKSVSPPPENNTPITPSSPRQSYNSNTVSNSMGIGPYPIKEISLAPTRGVSPTPLKEMSHSLSTRGVSPSPSGRGVNTTSTRPSSPHQSCDSNTVPIFTEIDPSPSTRGGSHRSRRSSGSRLFFSSSILSMFTKYADRQKEKNKEDARRLDLLRNIQVQWQFVNASAEAVLDLQRVTAENSLFDMWRTILELWDSVAAMKMDINQLILQLKLYAILFRQMAYIDEWGLIQREYESALSVTTTDLYARTLRLPTTEGVQVDVKALKLAVSSVVQLMQTATSSIESTLSKLDGTHILASELAKIVSHERFLLDECEIFLASAAPLQIEECSLRSQLIQSKRE